MKYEWLIVHIVAWICSTIISVQIDSEWIFSAPVISSIIFLVTEYNTNKMGIIWMSVHIVTWITSTIVAWHTSGWAYIAPVAASIIYGLGHSIFDDRKTKED